MATVESFAPGSNPAPYGANGDQTGYGTPQGQMTYARVSQGNANTVRDAQEYLKAHGYNVGGVDGIFGPNTSRALKNYLNAIHPNAHNAQMNAIANKHPQTGRFQSPATLAKTTKVGKGSNAKSGNGRSGGGGGGGTSGANTSSGVLNPKKEAQALANAEFNPAIQSLQLQLGNVGNQNDYNQKQIKGWTAQMQNLLRGQSATQGQQTTAQENQVAQVMGNVAQLFGGSTAGSMAPAAANENGLLATEGQSQQDYLANMLPLLAAQGQTADTNEQNTANAQTANYQQQLTQQQNAKGSAYNADYQQALSDQATQQQNALALAQAQALLPSQIASGKAQAQVDRTNARYAGPLNQAKLNATNAQVQHYAAMSNEEMAVAKKDLIAAKATGGKGALSPGSTTFERISTNLYKSMTNSSGKLAIPDPRRAQAALRQSAIQQGLINKQGKALVPGAVKVLTATLHQMYQRNANWQKNYVWNARKGMYVNKK